MNNIESRWTVYGKKADFGLIGQKYGIDPVVARVIRNRDIVSEKDIEAYLKADFSMCHDPFLMADMDKGCRIIAEKIECGKKIRIISDYDVDGVMSNYILLKGLKKAGAVVDYEIPDRILDGYGINERIINDAYTDGVDTIITCDNGIAAFSAIKLAKDLGMTVVVTDHHEVPYEINEDGDRKYNLVPADAVIDIKRIDCKYPYKGLCGAGVAYKFIRSLYKVIDIAWDDEEEYLDALAVATVCDVMELRDENRVYVKRGLKVLENTSNKGLAALIFVNSLKDKSLKAYHLGFIIGPCINATGRLESAQKGLELLLTEDYQEALILAEQLKVLNEQRKSMTEDGVEEAIKLIEEKHSEDKVLVIHIPKLHESLAGIVAGRIREAYYKPVFVFTGDIEGIVKGSGRSIEGYHMYDSLNECKEYLLKYGGHELAAGLSLEGDRLDDLRRALNEKCKLTDEQLIPLVRLDVAMPVSYISEKLIEDLDLLEPFGKGNEKPLFGQSNLAVKCAMKMGKNGQFVKIIFMTEQGFTIEAVDFNGNKFTDCIKMWFSEEECDKMFKGLSNDIRLDVAYYPDINEYMGRRTIQIKPVTYRKHND